MQTGPEPRFMLRDGQWSGLGWAGRGWLCGQGQPRPSRGRGLVESHQSHHREFNEAARSGEGRKGAAVTDPHWQGTGALVQIGRQREDEVPGAAMVPSAVPSARRNVCATCSGVREATGSVGCVCKRPQPPRVCQSRAPFLTPVMSRSDRQHHSRSSCHLLAHAAGDKFQHVSLRGRQE